VVLKLGRDRSEARLAANGNINWLNAANPSE